MQLSSFSDYAVRVLMYAALHEGSFQLDQVAAAFGISRHHLGKVVNHLAQQGCLKTRRGRGGGIQLAWPPAQIRLGDLVRAAEDQPVFVECFASASNTCVLNGRCLLKSVLAEARNAFYETLNRYTVADLVTGPHRVRMINTLLPDKR